MSRKTLNLIQWNLMPRVTNAVRVMSPCHRLTIESKERIVGRVLRSGRKDILIRRHDVESTDGLIPTASMWMAMKFADKLNDAKRRVLYDELSYLRSFSEAS